MQEARGSSPLSSTAGQSISFERLIHKHRRPYSSKVPLPRRRDAPATAQSAQWSRILYSYGAATARLAETRIQQETTSWANATDTRYRYDNAGDVTTVSEAVAGDTQCFTYDYAQRLTAAWAQTAATCPAGPPGASGIGGPAPYQQQLSYDPAGNITAAALTSPTATTSTYPPAGTSQPHAVTSQQATTTPGGTTTTSYLYTPAGQTSSITTGTAELSLTWNDPGQLTTATDTAGNTISYRYDAAGSLTVRQDNATSTLYLPGEELTATPTTVTATRYYTHAGQVIAARTPTGLTWLLPDPQGTGTAAVDTTTQATTKRYYTPFGAPRGPAPTTWPGDRGFVSGTTDPITGLTNLGAREYNPHPEHLPQPRPRLHPLHPAKPQPLHLRPKQPRHPRRPQRPAHRLRR